LYIYQDMKKKPYDTPYPLSQAEKWWGEGGLQPPAM
jgi:hypothetical protein